MIRNAVLALALVLSAAQARAEDELVHGDEGWRPLVEQAVTDNWVAGGETDDALTAPLLACQGTACATIAEIRLTPDEAGRIRAIFAAPPATPEAERAAMAAAIALFETFVGARNGTWRDHARNLHDEGEEGQMDCVSEAANTRSYLHRLVQARLLAHHQVGGFVTRYLVLLQHVAVELTETASGDSWVIDSWDGENGEPPVIEPYGSWRLEFMA